jgi:hypothetical protein
MLCGARSRAVALKNASTTLPTAQTAWTLPPLSYDLPPVCGSPRNFSWWEGGVLWCGIGFDWKREPAGVEALQSQARALSVRRLVLVFRAISFQLKPAL